jgi:hypothetical protein
MDRDSILAHSIAAYMKECFMERSDGYTMPVCVGCGTSPIWNPRLGIAVCPLCDGPVRFAGDNVNNLELLPPLGKPKSQIVEVDIPYATKVLGQELETNLNMGMRYITTAGVQRLQQFELAARTGDSSKTLAPLILPEVKMPERMVEKEETVVTREQLEAMGVDVGRLEGVAAAAGEAAAAAAAANEIYEGGEEVEGEGEVEGAEALAVPAVVQLAAPVPAVAQPGEVRSISFGQPAVDRVAMPAAPAQQQLPIEQSGGSAQILPSPLPGVPVNTLVIDTSQQAMERDGLYDAGGAALPRRRIGGMTPSQQSSSSSRISVQRMQETDPESGEVIRLNPHAPRVSVQKLG